MDLRREAPVRIRSAGIGLVRCLSLPVFDNSLRFL
jgi:hypothetical protein